MGQPADRQGHLGPPGVAQVPVNGARWLRLMQKAETDGFCSEEHLLCSSPGSDALVMLKMQAWSILKDIHPGPRPGLCALPSPAWERAEVAGQVPLDLGSHSNWHSLRTVRSRVPSLCPSPLSRASGHIETGRKLLSLQLPGSGGGRGAACLARRGEKSQPAPQLGWVGVAVPLALQLSGIKVLSQLQVIAGPS